MSRLITIFCLSFSVFSCSMIDEKYERSYFNMDSLINEQLTILARSKASLEKTASVNDHYNKVTSVPDSLEWATQMDVFRSLGVINKPSFRGLYRLEEGDDTKSNLRVRTLTATRFAPVSFFRIYYLNSAHNLKKIEGSYTESNALYSATSHLILDFEEVNGKPLLNGYRIKGFQKMLLADSVHFTIDAYVIFY